jgi:hypothetical protein
MRRVEARRVLMRRTMKMVSTLLDNTWYQFLTSFPVSSCA